jgi:hypothetical protein
MTKRRIWGDREPIAGADLTDIGNYTEGALGDLSLGFGPGILQGFGVTQTTTPSASVTVASGKVLITDPGVGRPRLLDLTANTALSFASKSIGSYAVVITAHEVGEDERTIVPPPIGHPFYEAGAQSYQLSTVQHWIADLSIQATPYTPAGAQAILAVVQWNGASVQSSDIALVLDVPMPLIATRGIQPYQISTILAGSGLSRDASGILGVLTDNLSLVVVGGKVKVADGGVTDVMIGARSIVSTTLPPTPTTLGTLSATLGWLGKAVQQITGEAGWNAAPATTLSELNANAARKANNESISGNWVFTSPASVPTPTAVTHAAPKGYVDNLVNTSVGAATGGLTAHKAASVLDHPDGSVTDAKIGNRSISEALSLPNSVGQQVGLQPALDWIGRALNDIKGTVHWYDPTAGNLTTLNNRLVAVESGSGTVPDGSITDAKLGQRSITDGVAPGGNSASLTSLLSNLANRLKGITGETSWLTAPVTTISELNTNAARKPNNETITGIWSFNNPVNVPTPVNASHAAPKSYVDAVAAGGTANSSALGTHRTAAILDHPDGSVTAVKLSATAVQDKLGYTPVSPAGGDLGGLRLTNGAEVLKLLPGGTNYTLLGLYARDNITRSGLLGYTTAGSTQLELRNDLGNLLLTAAAGNNIQVTGVIQGSSDIQAAHELIAHNGYGDYIAIGGDSGGNDYELRIQAANKPLSIYSPGGPVTVNVSGSLSATSFSATTGVFSGAVQVGTFQIGGQNLYVSGGALKLAGVVVDSLSVGPNAVWHAGNLDPATIAASGNVSGATILSRLLPVDGTGSGLDADLLDGLQGSDFARTVHTHVKAQITDFAHTHPVGDLPVAASGEANPSKIVQSDDSRLSDSRTPLAHTHTKSQITDFAHTHAIGDVTGLQSGLDGKANVVHGHVISGVTGLQAALDGKANASHRHNWTDLDGKPSTLAGYGINDGSVYDIASFIPGRPATSAVMVSFVAARTTTIQAANPGTARAITSASASTVFIIQNEGGAQIGTITFAAGATLGTVALNSDVVLNPNQLIIVRSPVTRDTTLSDIAVTFRARY